MWVRQLAAAAILQRRLGELVNIADEPSRVEHGLHRDTLQRTACLRALIATITDLLLAIVLHGDLVTALHAAGCLCTCHMRCSEADDCFINL